MRSIYNAIIDRLARVTTSGRRIRELDGLRFIAIASVFVQHVLHVVTDSYADESQAHFDLLARLVRDYRFGVELFFVISGFILGMPFAAHHLLGKRKVELKPYYMRRLTRLEPPYVLTLLLWFAVLVFYWGQSATTLWPHFWASLFYVHNFVYKEFSWINSVAWSLEIEVQFYILAPLLAMVFAIPHRWFRRAVLLVGVLLIQQGYKMLAHWAPAISGAGGVGGTIINAAPLFLMGFLLADIYLVDWKEDPQPAWWGDWVAGLGWIALPFYFQPHVQAIIRPTFFPLILLVLCYASFRSFHVRRILASSFIMTVGGMCYSIYLLHYPMIRILGQYMPVTPLGNHVGANMILMSVVMGVPVLIVSSLFFAWVEKPCMVRDWPQQLWARITGKQKHVHLELSQHPQDKPVP